MKTLVACALVLSSFFHLAFATRLDVKDGVEANGRASAEWLRAVEARVSTATYQAIVKGNKPLTAEEKAWKRAIVNVAQTWVTRVERLHHPFENISYPKGVTLLFGNRGGDDGFSCGVRELCFDLSAWQSAYGNANVKEHGDRISRILSHEYTHLLTRHWKIQNKFAADTPFKRALWELFDEGFGNYRSLSQKWLPVGGKHSPEAQKALAKHQGTFVDRLSRLAKTMNKEEESTLRQGLSSGPFPEKWGALTVALWLAMEANGDDAKLKPFVKSGPGGVIELARKHLPSELKQVLVVIP